MRIGRITKNRRKSICAKCGFEIKSRYKVDIDNNQGFFGTWGNKNFLHLGCARARLITLIAKYEDNIKLIKKDLKELNLQKYKRAMLVDKLNNNPQITNGS